MVVLLTVTACLVDATASVEPVDEAKICVAGTAVDITVETVCCLFTKAVVDLCGMFV